MRRPDVQRASFFSLIYFLRRPDVQKVDTTTQFIGTRLFLSWKAETMHLAFRKRNKCCGLCEVGLNGLRGRQLPWAILGVKNTKKTAFFYCQTVMQTSSTTSKYLTLIWRPQRSLTSRQVKVDWTSIYCSWGFYYELEVAVVVEVCWQSMKQLRLQLLPLPIFKLFSEGILVKLEAGKGWVLGKLELTEATGTLRSRILHRMVTDIFVADQTVHFPNKLFKSCYQWP